MNLWSLIGRYLLGMARTPNNQISFFARRAAGSIRHRRFKIGISALQMALEIIHDEAVSVSFIAIEHLHKAVARAYAKIGMLFRARQILRGGIKILEEFPASCQNRKRLQKLMRDIRTTELSALNRRKQHTDSHRQDPAKNDMHGYLTAKIKKHQRPASQPSSQEIEYERRLFESPLKLSDDILKRESSLPEMDVEEDPERRALFQHLPPDDKIDPSS